MSATILLVDDDQALLRALPEALRLRMPDVGVATASSAAEALELVDRVEYDAIVTDIKMPGIDGLELLRELRRVRPGTPTLLITGHGEHDLALQALRGGAYDFIQKPIDREYIVASLRRAIENSRLTRRVEEQRRALERRSRVLNDLSEGVIVVGADGSVELWNEAAAFATGIPAVEAVGHPIETLLPDWAEVVRSVEVSDAHSPGSLPPRILPLQIGRDEVWLSFNAVRLDGSIVYTFREAAAERAVGELTSDFLATVSHELRTPIASVIGAAATLAARNGLDEEVRRRLLAVLLQESGRLQRLVEDLLTASALERDRVAVEAEPVDSVGLLESVVHALRLADPDAWAIELDVPDEAPLLLSDRDKLRQVLTNLIDNALKHTPPDTAVTVGVERGELSVRFFVRDRGQGISPDLQRRIFEKFHRGDPRQSVGVRGSGLGLYISRELVRRMGGRLSVSSAPGEGAAFFVDLPLELPAASAQDGRATAAKS